MREFRSFRTFADEKESLFKEMIEAGLCEVYECGWQNLGNYNTDYVGDDIRIIPDRADVRSSVMDKEEYASTVLANTTGCNAEDFVCEETGKVLVVQFYDPED